jgi:hypothetical protein
MNIDWKNLPFGYMKTDVNVRAYYRDGAWSDIEITDSEYIPTHIAATGLHYGQQAFEGMKAYRGKKRRHSFISLARKCCSFATFSSRHLHGRSS